MEYVILSVAVVAALVIVSWVVTASSRVWVIRLRNGTPVLVKGRIAPMVVSELGEVLQRHGVRRGALYGVRRRGTVALGFSPSIPQKCRQALRNVWSMHAR
jgi:Protein of unknown function (DUF3634)